MPTIHPTSCVDKQAVLADDVEVGPYCIIQGQVHLGPGTRLISNVQLQGPLRMGQGNTLYPFVCLGFSPQDLKFDPQTPGAGLDIGDNNVFREGVSIHRATGDTPTQVGCRNYLMAYSHLGHDSALGSDCMLANNAVVGGHAVIGDRVILGGNAAVHQFCRVGRLAMLSGTAGIVKDLPPFCISYSLRTVGSLNIVGLRRAGYRQHIAPLKQAFALLYQQRHTNTAAANLIEQQLGDDPLCRELAGFVRSSVRGITRYTRENRDDD